MIQTAPAQSRMAMDNPPRASRSKKLVGSSNWRVDKAGVASAKGHQFTAGACCCTHDEDLGRVDQRGTNDDLDLLSTGQSANLVVLSDIGVETDLLEQFSDGTSREISSTGSFSRRLHVVELSEHLLESVLEQILSGQPGVVPVVHPLELDLVLETLLELLSSEDLLDSSLVTVLAGDLGVHHTPVILGQRSRSLGQHFTIVSVLVTPLTGGRGEIDQRGVLRVVKRPYTYM